MKLITLICFSLLLIRCSSSHIEASKKSSINLLYMPQINQNDVLNNNLFQVEIWYSEINDGLFKFIFSITNNSADTITISPTSFYYNFKDDSLEKIIQCIAPEKEIDSLEQVKSFLLKEVNPYSLKNKSVGEIIKEGLISGTIATMSGQKVEDVESQRKEDEQEWEDKHKSEIKEVNRKISFWQNNMLKQTNISPNNKIVETVFFPIIQYAKEVEIVLTISNKNFTFKYKQVNKN